MTKELIERLRDTASKGVSVWGDLQMEAAKEIEILTAEREAYASAMDRMKAELAAIKNQEPVAWRMDWINHGPSFTADKSDYVTWFAGKESYPKELVPLFAAPVPELRGVTDAQGLPSMAAPAHTTGESSGHPTPPVQEPVGSVEVFPFSNPGLRTVRFTEYEQLPVGVTRVFAKPTPPVREPLSYRDILRIYNEVGPEDGVPYRFAGAIEAITKEQA